VSKRVDSVVQPVLYSLRSTRLSDAALPPWKQTRSDVPRCLEKSSAHRACTAPGWCPASCRGRNSGSVNWSDEQIAAWKKARFLFRRIGAVDVVTWWVLHYVSSRVSPVSPSRLQPMPPIRLHIFDISFVLQSDRLAS
jgi:hypothetical protein